MNSIEKVFDNYVNKFMNDEKNIAGYQDKYHHSYFVRKEALLIDSTFTKYNPDFRTLLEIQSLYHDIGRFKQLSLTGNFIDSDLYKKYGIFDHGYLGAIIMQEEGLLRQIFPDNTIFDDEIVKAIRLHVKDNSRLLSLIKKDYLDLFRNYELKELFQSNHSKEERNVLTALNIAIIQDADRLDIFRKIVNGIWIPECSNEKISEEVWKLFKAGRLPSMSELKDKGLWNANVGHLVRMNFVNQMCLVDELEKIQNENLIEQIYKISGNEIVRPAYEYAKVRLETLINESEDKILVKKI